MSSQLHVRPWLACLILGPRVVLFLILLSAFIQFVAFSLNQVYILSYFGAQPEDITFSVQLSYVGILASLPILFRFIQHFEMKSIMVFMLMVGIGLCIAILNTHNIVLFFIIRFFQGAVVASIAISIRLEITGFLHKAETQQVFGSAIFYGTILCSNVLIGLAASNVEINGSFIELYRYLILYLVFILVLVLLSFKSKTDMRPFPLYQIDWIGACFFILGSISLAYTIIYGSKYYWFTDYRIRISALLCITGSLLFIWRELTVKRPGVDLSVFKYPRFLAGLILMALYYGTKESVNLIYGYTSNILQWSPVHVIYLGLASVAGIVIFMIIMAQLLVREKVTIPALFILGFSMLLLYHLWVYFIFTPDLSYQDLMLPVFFQGAASGVLFVPIMLMMLVSVPPSTGITGLIVAAYARFVTLLNVSAGFYNLQLKYNQLYKEGFLRHLTSIDEQTTERLENFRQLYLSKGFSQDQAAALANSALARALSVQSQLLTNRAVFLFMSIMVMIILAILLIIYFKGLYKKFTAQSVQVVTT